MIRICWLRALALSWKRSTASRPTSFFHEARLTYSRSVFKCEIDSPSSIDLGFAFPAAVLECFVVASHNFSNQSAWSLFRKLKQQRSGAEEYGASAKLQSSFRQSTVERSACAGHHQQNCGRKKRGQTAASREGIFQFVLLAQSGLLVSPIRVCRP